MPCRMRSNWPTIVPAVCVSGLQRGEGDGGNDGKEDLRAQPDDEREIEKGAEKSLHEAAVSTSDTSQ